LCKYGIWCIILCSVYWIVIVLFDCHVVSFVHSHPNYFYSHRDWICSTVHGFRRWVVPLMVAVYCCGALYCQYLLQPHSLVIGIEAAFACYITLSMFLLYKPNGKRDKVIVLVAVWPSGPRLGASGTGLEEWRWACCDGASVHDGAKCNWIVILQQCTLISVCFGQCCRWV